ncbi:MAG: sensor histidine kinase, partial [Bacteroidota bacterium]
MTIDRKIVLAEARDLAMFGLICVLQAYLVCPSCDTAGEYVQVWFFSLLTWIFLWKGNGFLSDYISAKIPWIKFPVKRLLVGIVGTVVYTVGAVVCLMSFFEAGFDFNFGSGYRYTIYGSMGVTIIISLVLHSRAFFLHWQQASLDAEKFEKESIMAKYESLKNQVNPHFLFNSFNALTNLVYEDQEKAVKFIKQLSDVYRYVLDTRDKELVSLEEEQRFLLSYIYLEKIRFGDKLNIDIQLPQTKTKVAPLALQMLVENAIKHNIISEDDPLFVRLYQENGFIVVENN